MGFTDFFLPDSILFYWSSIFTFLGCSVFSSSIIALHTRWSDDTSVYVNLYEQIDDVQRMPRIDWAPVFNQKQVSADPARTGNL